ncbi:MAG: DNA gyrase inhibitor YacG [Gammaproteobacteria bacterium]|jgi:endogenous inhibitor of DNA gyrase (YacG/DUF329 family)
MVKIVKCPTCEREVEWSTDNPWRPFCSERCKLIDLGEWASESHRIAGDTADDFALPDQGDKPHYSD